MLALYVQELISFLINYHITLQDHINVIHSFTLHTYRENQKNEYQFGPKQSTVKYKLACKKMKRKIKRREKVNLKIDF